MHTSLTYAYAPPTVAVIEDNAFGKCLRLTLLGEPGSAIEANAAENGIPFKTGK